MIQYKNRASGTVYSDNHIDPFLTFETAATWSITLGTGTALHSAQQSFEGSQSLRIENTDPVNDLICTNSNQSTIIPRDGIYGMAIYLRKNTTTEDISGFMNIFKNAVLLTSQSFVIVSSESNVQIRYLVDVDLTLSKLDDITIDFTIKGVTTVDISTTMFVDGIMLYNKERLQETPPFYTVPSSADNGVYDNQITVNQSDFATKLAVIDSTKQYFIDGIVDVGGTNIEIPVGGMQLAGLGMDVSKLISSNAAFALFTSPLGGSGNVFASNLSYEVTGAGSQLYDIEAATGDEAIEHERVNFNNCSSMGEITGYRQGLEINTGRFGGQPSLKLSGTWAGGYRIATSIVRNIDNAMTNALFQEGTAFTMGSRFLTGMNADLGTLAPLIDFQSSNFTSPSSLQLVGCEITRNGVFDSSDTTIYPNINQTDISSAWKGNKGLPNTFVGGKNLITLAVATPIVSTAFVDLLGGYAATDLQHFDSPSSGQLRHLGIEPREYTVSGFFIIDGTAGHVITLRYSMWDDSTSTFIPTVGVTLEINNNTGSSDNFSVYYEEDIILDQNDFVKVEVSNANSADVTAELNSSFKVKAR